jgi:hypothetical protein
MPGASEGQAMLVLETLNPFMDTVDGVLAMIYHGNHPVKDVG